MMRFLLLLVLASCVVALRSKKVIQLSPGNFNEVTTTEPLLLVSYYAPWCAHCKKLANELIEVAEDLIEMDIPAKVATIDVTLAGNADIAEKEGITAYPTLVVYKNGVKSNEYLGSRQQKDIVHYLRHKSNPATRRISDLAELLPYLEQFESGELQEVGFFSIVLGLFKPIEQNDPNMGIDGRYATLFNATAAHYDLALFFYSDEPALLQQLHVQSDSLVVFQEFPDESHDVFEFTPAITQKDIISYLLREALPLTVPYAPETLSAISFHPVKSHALMFTNTSGAEDSFTDLLEGVAQHYKGRLLFVEVNPEEYQLAAYFGLRTHQLPQLVIANMTDEDSLRRHHFSDYLHEHPPSVAADVNDNGHFMVYATEGAEQQLQYTDQQLFAFFDAYLSDTLRPRLLSDAESDMEKLNDHTLGGYMENIAGSQFQAKVIDQVTHNSFVFFHAPWCAHCKSLEPVMSEVGRHYLEDPSFMLFRIDGTRNDVLHAGVRVVGYPTLYFFPANRKESPMEYDGDRSPEAIVEFIEAFKHSSEAVAKTPSEEEEESGDDDGEEGKLGEDLSRAEVEASGSAKNSGKITGSESSKVTE